MRRFLLTAGAIIVALIVWTGALMGGVLMGWWHTPLAPRGDTAAFAKAAAAKIDADHKGVVSFALIEKGKVVARHFADSGTPVDDDTLYQVASLSKWVTSWGVMHLVEQGEIDLDKPVDTYLKRWHLPKSGFDNNKVTVRLLLSHTSGLVDGLGYAGFKPGEKVQTVVESLQHTADASPGRDGYVRVGMEPGKQWKYSGGGYTILQLLIEDVSGKPFNDYMRETVFLPLGMTRSTYLLPEGGGTNIAGFYDLEGKPAIHYRFAALAAASLYTSTHDMARFIAANTPDANGEPAGRGILKPETLKEMRKPLAYQYGAAIWGMGNILFAPNNSGDFIVGHDGDNEPAINTSARVDPASGDGIVVLESGNDLLGSEIGGEWTFWRTGNVDLIMALTGFNRTFPYLVGGAIVILMAGIFLGWRGRRRRHA